MAQVDLSSLAISIVVLGIVTSIGATILINIRDTNTLTSGNIYDNSTNVAYNVSNEASIGLAEYGNWFKILVIVGVAAVILGLIFLAFRPRAATPTY